MHRQEFYCYGRAVSSAILSESRYRGNCSYLSGDKSIAMKNFLVVLLLTFATGIYGQTEVTFYTSKGNFSVSLNDSLMPITTGNFISLVNSKGYDGKTFYRVISNFVIQGGYRTNTPPAIPDEFDSTGVLSNRRWKIAMANSGPNTGSSEFFINLKDNLFLDYDKPPLTSAHPVFGSVSSGWTTVSDIGLVATDPNDQPLIPVVMDSLRVTSSPLDLKHYSLEKAPSVVYPNPISGNSILAISAAQSETIGLKLFDHSSRLLLDQNIWLTEGDNQINLTELGLDHLPKGSYLLHIDRPGNSEFIALQIW